jgi:hypothetical protein
MPTLTRASSRVCRQNISDRPQESVWLIWFKGSGCDCLLMHAPSLLDGFPFDALASFENA